MRKQCPCPGSLQMDHGYKSTEKHRLPYIVVHQGNPDEALYDVSCDGTWVLAKDAVTKMAWDSRNQNDYENSEINQYINGTYFSLLSDTVQQMVKHVKLPYRPGAGGGSVIKTQAEGLDQNVFLLSAREAGFMNDRTNISIHRNFLQDGVVLEYFSEGEYARDKYNTYLDGELAAWWLRSPWTLNPDRAIAAFSDVNWLGEGLSSFGTVGAANTMLSQCPTPPLIDMPITLRPAMILDPNAWVNTSAA